MAVSKEARIEAVKVMIAEGWSPPVPSEVQTHRLLDDMIHVHPQATINLAPSEIRVVRLVAEGHREKEIAEIIGVAFYTVRQQARVVKRKLGARSMAHAVAICFRAGVLD